MNQNIIIEKLQLMLSQYMISGPVGAILQLIIDRSWTSVNYAKTLDEYHIRANSVDFKKESLRVALQYAKMCLEDDALSQEEIDGMTLLKRLLMIHEGDFYKYGFEEEVKALIMRQLNWMYNDGEIDEQEALHKVELQGLFNLSYNEFDDIVHEIARECVEKGADISKLDTNLFIPREL